VKSNEISVNSENIDEEADREEAETGNVIGGGRS
jgi:hypothetical protein